MRLKGIFSDWYCPNCNCTIRRKDVKYQSEWNGMCIIYWFRCLKCGKKGAKLLKDRVK